MGVWDADSSSLSVDVKVSRAVRVVDSGACKGAFKDAIIEFVRIMMLGWWVCWCWLLVSRGRKLWMSAMGYKTRVLRRSDQMDGERVGLEIGAEG